VRLLAFGVEPVGVVAIGANATGVIAIGQLATGVVAVGQLARGVVVVGQLAVGLVAFGQLTVGVLWTGGQLAFGAGRRGPAMLPAVPRALSWRLWFGAVLLAIWWFAAGVSLSDAVTREGGIFRDAPPPPPTSCADDPFRDC
jgi:hypothetical protein